MGRPRVGHGTAGSDDWGWSARIGAQPGNPRAPRAPAGETTVLSQENWERWGYHREATCPGSYSGPGVSSAVQDVEESRPGAHGVSRYSPAPPSRAGGVGSGRPARPPGRAQGAGPHQPRPSAIGWGARGGAQLPDVGAAAAAGATKREESPNKAEGKGAAGRPAGPFPRRSR